MSQHEDDLLDEEFLASLDSDDNDNDDVKMVDGVPQPSSKDSKKKSFGKRFKQVYAKWQDAERKISEMSEQSAGIASKYEMLQGEYKKVSDAVADILSKQESNKDKKQASDYQDRINKKNDELAAAIKDEDWGRATVIQGQISALMIESVRESNVPIDTKKLVEEITEKVSGNVSGKVDVASNNALYEAWKTSNKWYGKDDLKTYFANGKATELAKTPKYASGQKYGELLEEVTKAVNERFKTKPSATSVETGDYSTDANSDTDGLSKDEIAMANALGISPKDYARNKKLTGGKK